MVKHNYYLITAFLTLKLPTSSQHHKGTLTCVVVCAEFARWR